MDERSTGVKAYRWAVFLITLGYFLYRFYETSPGYFGAQFRFLTIWALTASTISAGLMLRYSVGWSDRRHEVLPSVAVVLNATVVLMYWKIYFQDPTLFYGADGTPSPWHQEYFLHALGPALQIFDAMFILGAFRPIRRIAAWVAFIPVAYIVWIEALVSPMNERPIGSVTTGLPYLFLNNMDVSGRTTFYVTTVLTMIVLMLIAWAIAALLRRLRASPQSVSQSL